MANVNPSLREDGRAHRRTRILRSFKCQGTAIIGCEIERDEFHMVTI